MTKTETALVDLLGVLLKANANGEIMRALEAEGLAGAYMLSVKDSLKSLGRSAISEFERRNQVTVPTGCLSEPDDRVSQDSVEAEISAFMRERIEDGNLEAGDIPVRLARYGLMLPELFIDEMRERMASAEH